MIFQGRRSVVRLPRLALQYLGNRRTAVSSSCVERVPALYSVFQSQQYSDIASDNNLGTLVLRRTYAQRAVSRPKAHTGRTTTAARKAPTTSKTTAAKKPAPKRTTPKAVPGAKSKAKPRIKAKPKPAKKKRAKAKPKPKPKAKKPKKVLTQEQTLAKTKSELKKTALKPPHARPPTAWQVFFQEKVKTVPPGGKGKIGSAATEASVEYKQLTPEQVEHYNHLANQNKAANDTAYRQWIESYTPAIIYKANLARLYLKRLGGRLQLLRDDRQVKRLRNAYNLFYQHRMISGDFKGLKVFEAAKLIGREWRGLPANEKKHFDDMAAQDKSRYTQEVKTVMNRDVRSAKAKS